MPNLRSQSPPSDEQPEPRAIGSDTKRGDADARRRDILQAAQELLRESGYAALHMRGIAARAGVSPGTPYSYFASKEEIFVTLLAARLDALTQRLTTLGQDVATIEELFTAILPDFGNVYRDFAANIAAWLKTREVADQAISRLRGAFRDAVDALEDAVRRTAGRSSLAMPDGDLMKTYLWALLIGLANVTMSGVPSMYAYTPESLAAFAARSLTFGLSASPDVPDTGERKPADR
jgi:AcrR family transcriptional regulator